MCEVCRSSVDSVELKIASKHLHHTAVTSAMVMRRWKERFAMLRNGVLRVWQDRGAMMKV
jgi:hypothetical protein